jgi:hypothetical protein
MERLLESVKQSTREFELPARVENPVPESYWVRRSEMTPALSRLSTLREIRPITMPTASATASQPTTPTPRASNQGTARTRLSSDCLLFFFPERLLCKTSLGSQAGWRVP